MQTETKPLTHAELVARLPRFLREDWRCTTTLSEARSELTGETVDQIGWCGRGSVVLDVKCSLADLKADARKPFRLDPHAGMGNYKIIICEPYVIEDVDVADHPGPWGLGWYYRETDQIRIIVEPTRHHSPNQDAEIELLCRAMKRLSYQSGRTADECKPGKKQHLPTHAHPRLRAYVRESPGCFTKDAARDLVVNYTKQPIPGLKTKIRRDATAGMIDGIRAVGPPPERLYPTCERCGRIEGETGPLGSISANVPLGPVEECGDCNKWACPECMENGECCEGGDS